MVEAFLSHKADVPIVSGKETVRKCASLLRRTLPIPSDQGTHFTGQILKILQTSWNYHCPYHLQLLGKVKRTNGILKLKTSKLVETIGFLWPKVLSKALLTVYSTHFGKHKLTPQKTVTNRPMSIGTQLSIYLLLFMLV